MNWVVKCRNSRAFLLSKAYCAPMPTLYGPYKKRGNAKRRAAWCRHQQWESIPFDTLEGSIASGDATIRMHWDERTVTPCYSRVSIARFSTT